MTLPEDNPADDEQESLIPEYIELTEDEKQFMEETPGSSLVSGPMTMQIIEKLVAHIEKQNTVIEKTALQILDLMTKLNK